MPDLNTVWFVLIGVLLAGYAVLDGFDLGIGILHLFTRTDEERRTLIKTIGPVWDGNEVWLITGGGALFAAFPEVYATVFSGFYLAFILLLFALIFRAVALEFRDKLPGARWQRTWDLSFGLGSLLASLLLGVALGNLVRGIALDATHEYVGGFRALLNPYALLTGVTTAALFTLHGALYGTLKTGGAVREKLAARTTTALPVFVACFVILTFTTLLGLSHFSARLPSRPWIFLIALVVLAALANIRHASARQRPGWAFLSSAVVIAGLLALFGAGLYPDLVYSNPQPEFSLTIYNAASSPATLKIMLIIAASGMPLVLAYTIVIYRIFRGPVTPDDHGY